jgi:hypothetical protein
VPCTSPTEKHSELSIGEGEEISALVGTSKSTLGLYRDRGLDLWTLVNSEAAIQDFKKMIYFKYVFLIGNQEVFESPAFHSFL